jgi:hypothetical protein
MRVMGIRRVFPVLWGLLAIASCRDPGSRADAAGGGAGGTGPSAGSGGALGGPSGAGSGGTAIAIDAPVDGPVDAGEADGPGGPDDVAEAGAALEPVRVSGGDPDASVAYNDLRFIGVGLEPYEGAVVTFRIGSSSGVWRFGSGQVRIIQGGFDVLFPGALAPITSRSSPTSMRTEAERAKSASPHSSTSGCSRRTGP